MSLICYQERASAHTEGCCDGQGGVIGKPAARKLWVPVCPHGSASALWVRYYYYYRGCSGLTALTLPDTLTSVDHGAFRGCSGLTALTLPDTLTSIGAYVFGECKGLTSITLPDTLTTVGDGVFYHCDPGHW